MQTRLLTGCDLGLAHLGSLDLGFFSCKIKAEELNDLSAPLSAKFLLFGDDCLLIAAIISKHVFGKTSPHLQGSMTVCCHVSEVVIRSGLGHLQL